MVPLGLYVHIPFCPQHCPYCAFAVVTGHETLHARYVTAVCREMCRWHARLSGQPLQSIFFGGGTPSLLAPAHVQRLLDTARQLWGFTADAEITLEANPGTADRQHFAAFREQGFNRLSLGVQSFHNADLRTLGRLHSAEEAITAYTTARQAGFDNVNIDVIFSVPGEPRQHWPATIRQLLALAPEHISTYALTIEEGTRFAQRHARGRLTLVSEDDDAWAYGWAIDTLTEAGYEHYEVANFARPGYRCRHNWGYWHGMDYLGVGMSAHSLLAGRRHWNVRELQAYLTAVEAGQWPCQEAEELDTASARQERLWLELRTCAGATLSPTEHQRLLRAPKFHAMHSAGWLRLDEAHLCLTPAGFLLADAIGLELWHILAGSQA